MRTVAKCKTCHCAHKDLVPSLVPQYKVLTLYSGTGTEPKFCMGTKKNSVFINIGALLRIVPGHKV